MERMDHADLPRHRTTRASVLTDIHFWVPVVVLMGGLLLLGFIH